MFQYKIGQKLLVIDEYEDEPNLPFYGQIVEVLESYNHPDELEPCYIIKGYENTKWVFPHSMFEPYMEVIHRN